MRPKGAVRPSLWLVLFLVLTIAATLRVVALDFGLPYPLAVIDESIIMDRAMQMNQGDLNPHYFAFPTLYFYLVAFALRIAGIVFVMLGSFESFESWVEAYYLSPGLHMLVARGLTAILGVLAVPLVYCISRDLMRLRSDRGQDGPWPRVAGVASAVVLGCNLLHVDCSRTVLLDVPLSLFAALALYLVLRYLTTGRVSSILLSALAAGLGTSVKYYGALLCLPIAAAVFLKPRAEPSLRQAWTRKARLLLGSAGCMVAAFLIGSPYIVLDFKTFSREFIQLCTHMAGGHAGQEVARNGYLVYASLLEDWSGTFACAAAAAGLIALCCHPRSVRATLVLATFPVAQFLLISGFRAQFDRYLVPLLPMIAVAAGSGVTVALSTLARIRAPSLRIASLVAGAVVIAIPLFLEIDRCLVRGLQRSRPDTRVLVNDWLCANIESGARIATDIWLELPLTVDCLSSMLEEMNTASALARGEERPPRPASERRACGSLTRKHLETRLELAATVMEGPAFDMALLLPNQFSEKILPALKASGFRFLVLSGNRFRRILDNPILEHPELEDHKGYAMWADFYRRLLSSDCVMKRFEPAAGEGSGPNVVICNLDHWQSPEPSQPVVDITR